MKESNLRTFLEEATIRSGGSHDGMSAKIRFEHSMDDLVVAHENIHHEIFSLYPDAQVLGMLLYSQRPEVYTKLDAVTAQEYRAVCERIYESSRFAQEVFATYLSVKMFSSDAQNSQLQRYPKVYVSFYRYLAEVIDPIFPSRELQYIAALAMACMSFSSPFALRFLRNLPQSALSPDAMEMADDRLRSLIDAFDNAARNSELLGNLQELGRRTAVGIGFEPWDLQSETAWRETPKWAFDKMSSVLGEYIGNWLLDLVSFECCYESEEKGHLYRKFGESLGVTVELFPIDESAGTSRAAAFRSINASRAGKSVIINKSIIDPLRGSDLINSFNVHHHMAIGGTAVSVDELDLFAGSEIEEISSLCGKIPFDAVERNLWNWRLMEGVSADLRFHLKSIVLGVRSYEELEIWWKRMHNLLQHLPGGKSDRKFPYKLFIYLHGDFDEWLKLFQKPLLYTSFEFKSKVFQHAGCSVKVFTRAPEKEIYYIRIFSHSASKSFADHENAMNDEGEIVELEQILDIEDIKLAVTAACNLCISMWPEF